MMTKLPNVIPIDPMLAKPHRAYVEITAARSVYKRELGY